MPENHLFEYAVVRVVPRVEREEFLNVGLILYCPSLKYLNMVFQIDPKKFKAFCGEIDIPEIEAHLLSYQHIALGLKEGGPLASFDMASRFRWLTATRSTMVQSSKVHPGLGKDPDHVLQKLFQELVF